MKTSKVIVLYGSGNIGKTTTLRMVIDMLNRDELSYSRKDVRTTCHYNGKIVDIATWGDNRSELLKNVKYFREHHCDIAITAARSYGGTHDVIREYAKEIGLDVEKDIVWVKKEVSGNRESNKMEEINKNDACRIVKEIIGDNK